MTWFAEAIRSLILRRARELYTASEQYYHAPGKCSIMVLEVGARALTKHALNVHCGHDDGAMRARGQVDHSVWQRRATSG